LKCSLSETRDESDVAVVVAVVVGGGGVIFSSILEALILSSISAISSAS